MSAPTAHTLTIGPDGRLTGLQTKKGQGCDLRQFGKAEIVRTTLIEWVASEQKWHIRFLKKGPFQGLVTAGLILMYVPHGFHPDAYYSKPLPWWAKWMWWKKRPLVGLWTDYEDAVRTEIALVQAIRLQEGPDIV